MRTEPYPDVPPDFGHWLAGFIDGEGHFSIPYTGNRKYPSLRPQFAVALRSDDAEVLKECQSVTGLGYIYVYQARANPNPTVAWQAGSKADTQRLLTLLERYPLRSKKRRDFLLWAQGVRAREQMRQGERDGRIRSHLEALRLEIINGRPWREHDSVLIPEPVELHAVPAGSDDRLALWSDGVP